MDIRRHFVRSTLVIGLFAALGAAPAPTFAGSLHTTLDVVAATPTLTLSSSGAVHVGLVRVEFATKNSSATHTVITISTPVPVTVAGTLSNGTTLTLPNNCTGTRAGNVFTTPVTCQLGHVHNDSSAPPILIEFQSPSACTGLSSSTPPCSLPFTATVNYSEGTLASKPNLSTTQSVQLFAASTPQHPQAAVGDCVPLSATLTTLSTLTDSLPQTAAATFGRVSTATGDPCTPAAVGAVNFPKPKPATFVLGQVWFVELDQLDPNVNNGLATATLQVTNVPDPDHFVLKEFAQSVFSPNFDPTQATPVPNCVGYPLQPPAGADSCIRSIQIGDGDEDDSSPATRDEDDNGMIFNLIIRPTGTDPGYCG